jgi:L-fuculose-phosphate aldolase
MEPERIRQDFARIGRRLFTEGLVRANFGNMSVRTGGGFAITRTGACLDTPGNPVLVPLEGAAPPEASNEYQVHCEVYHKTSYRALVHAHPPHAVALSLLLDSITPLDCEGIMFCPVIPVCGGEPGSRDLARNVAERLIGSRVTIARGHGTFARGNTLDEAYMLTSLAEHSCRVLILSGLFRDTARGSSGEERR